MLTPSVHTFAHGKPFSAVRPHHGSVPLEASPEICETQDTFFKSKPDTLGSFPQVVHLLVDPESQLAENLSQEAGLPLVTLGKSGVDGLESVLLRPEYARGFVLEGFPQSQADAQKLDDMLRATPAEDHRVLGWEFADPCRQEVLDHYLDSGLLWMVPSSTDGCEESDSTKSLQNCLTGLPAFR